MGTGIKSLKSQNIMIDLICLDVRDNFHDIDPIGFSPLHRFSSSGFKSPDSSICSCDFLDTILM